LDLEDEIAALRKAVRVMAIEIQEFVKLCDNIQFPIEGISRDVLDNPIAAAALKEAGK